jgi:hypothetical protein
VSPQLLTNFIKTFNTLLTVQKVDIRISHKRSPFGGYPVRSLTEKAATTAGNTTALLGTPEQVAETLA